MKCGFLFGTLEQNFVKVFAGWRVLGEGGGGEEPAVQAQKIHDDPIHGASQAGDEPRWFATAFLQVEETNSLCEANKVCGSFPPLSCMGSKSK